MKHMNDTPQTDEADTGRTFNRGGLRTLVDMRRSSDDRMVAGVCAGVARHLDVDPIIIRIAVVALTFVGLSGLILYLAAWFLIPADDEQKSVAADWFKLDRNEEQARTIGLFVALVLAVAAVVGDNGWGLWWLGWWVVPAAFLYWLFVVRPRRRREEWLAGTAPMTPPYPPPAPGTSEAPATGAPTTEYAVAEFTAWKTQQVHERKRQRWERRRESRVLRGLTLSVALIAEAIAVIVDRTIAPLPWTAYVAVGLAVVAVGCLVGTRWGSASGLIGIGLILTLVLTIGSLGHGGPIGQQSRTPHAISDIRPVYQHGIGDFELDLSHVNRPTSLAGRTIRIDAGIGRTAITVPSDVAVKLDASVQSGEISAFGRTWRGQDNTVTVTEGPRMGTGTGTAKPLHLVIHQELGEIEIDRGPRPASVPPVPQPSAPAVQNPAQVEEIHP